MSGRNGRRTPDTSVSNSQQQTRGKKTAAMAVAAAAAAPPPPPPANSIQKKVKGVKATREISSTGVKIIINLKWSLKRAAKPASPSPLWSLSVERLPLRSMPMSPANLHDTTFKSNAEPATLPASRQLQQPRYVSPDRYLTESSYHHQGARSFIHYQRHKTVWEYENTVDSINKR